MRKNIFFLLTFIYCFQLSAKITWPSQVSTNRNNIKATKYLIVTLLLMFQISFSQTTAYLSARKGEYIQVINTTTHTLSTTIGSAPGTPISTDTNWRNNERTIGISSDNKFLFQDCYNCGGGTKKINLIDGTLSNISGFSDKSGMVSNADGTKIFTAKAYSILMYDVNTNATITGYSSIADFSGSIFFATTNASGLTPANPANIRFANTTAFLQFDAEL